MNSASRGRRRRRTVDTSDYLTMTARILSAAGQRVGDGNVEDLRSLIELRAQLDDAIIDAVRGLRDTGVTWEDIGAATGTTRQAAIMKWSRKVA